MTSYKDVSKSPPIEQLAYWIRERENIRKKKEAGKPQPWTDDPILQKYRFCSVKREDDRVTRWLARHWRKYDDPNVWHAMIVARFINWPETLEYCGYPEPWSNRANGVNFQQKIKNMESRGQRIFTGAYIVSTNGATGSKVDHVLRLFDRAWKELKGKIEKEQTCQGFYDKLREVNGIGSFMAAQIVADVKYTAQLDDCYDWMDFVAPGPGSQRGLNRVLGYPTASQWNNKNFVLALHQLRIDLAVKILPMAAELHLQDLQNCLCEFDKYMRVLKDEGRPRSKYHKSSEAMP